MLRKFNVISVSRQSKRNFLVEAASQSLYNLTFQRTDPEAYGCATRTGLAKETLLGSKERIKTSDFL